MPFLQVLQWQRLPQGESQSPQVDAACDVDMVDVNRTHLGKRKREEAAPTGSRPLCNTLAAMLLGRMSLLHLHPAQPVLSYGLNVLAI